MTSLDGADADRGQSAVTRAGCAEEFPTAPMASGPLVREVVSMHYQPITQSRRRQRVYRRAVAAYFSRGSSFTEIELDEHEFCRRCQVKPRSLPLPLLLPPLQCMHGGIERRRRRKMRETSPVRVRSLIWRRVSCDRPRQAARQAADRHVHKCHTLVTRTTT